MLNGIKETVLYKEIEGFKLHDNTDYEVYPSHWHTPIEIIMPIRVMLMDVIADHHKLFGMFFLLGEGGVFVVSHAGKFTAHQDEHLDDPVIDGGADCFGKHYQRLRHP